MSRYSDAVNLASMLSIALVRRKGCAVKAKYWPANIGDIDPAFLVASGLRILPHFAGFCRG
jgi:hypothetical protein